jgi:hypothetical protein
MTEELYQFLACDYFGTGEGSTVCLLITRAYPRSEDYETHSDIVDGKFVPGTLKNSAKFRAAREFAEQFGSYLTQGAENLTREEFLERFSNHLPPYTEKILTSEDGPGNFNLKLQIHMNYS